MKIKKFKATTFTEALALVKKEFSEDAIILSTEEKKGIRSFVEITAAADYEMAAKKSGDARGKQNAGKGRCGALRKTGATPVSHGRSLSTGTDMPPLFSGELESLKKTLTDEIRHGIGNLSEILASVKDCGFDTSLPANKKIIFRFLRNLSVREEFALRLCKNANDLNDIPSLLSADIKIKEWDEFSHGSADRPGCPQAVMLIGPTGVGKTTTMAKLSAHAVSIGKRAAIASLDTYRIGAVEQARIYARIMGIPFSAITDIRELKKKLLHLAEHRDIIFIDTSGRNPRDKLYINNLLEISRLGFPLEIHLLMSASCNDEFMAEAYRHYSRLPVDCIAFTKIDEAVHFGSLYNFLLTSQKPVAYISTGQKVPDDIEFATVKKFTNLILKKGHYEC
jgi:flagellar biosynthesis protein FlhF